MPRSTFQERLILSDKITFIENYVKPSELAQMLGIDPRYLHKIKSTTRSGKKYKADINNIYKTFEALKKRRFVERRLSKKELERFSSLRKYSRIKAIVYITKKEKHKQDIIVINFNLKWIEKNKLIVLNRLLKVFNKYSKKSHVFNMVFSEFHFLIDEEPVIRHYGALKAGQDYNLKDYFTDTFIDVAPARSGTGIWGFENSPPLPIDRVIFLEYVVMKFV